MSAAMLLFLGLAVLAAIPVAWCLARAARRGSARRLVWPAGLALLGAVVLVIGGRHFGNGWPGTGGHPWPQQGLVPGGVAAFGWASTMWVTSYWAHPAALLSFPAGQIAWMAASPVAAACLTAGLMMTVRRLDLAPAVLRYEARVGWAAAGAMAAFLTGAACWVVGGGPGPRDLFQAGAIDVIAVLVMTVALAVGGHALRRARTAAPPGGAAPARW
jgi:hypothetical protein